MRLATKIILLFVLGFSAGFVSGFAIGMHSTRGAELEGHAHTTL